MKLIIDECFALDYYSCGRLHRWVLCLPNKQEMLLSIVDDAGGAVFLVRAVQDTVACVHILPSYYTPYTLDTIRSTKAKFVSLVRSQLW